MTSPSRLHTESRSSDRRIRLRDWLRRHDRALGKRAVGDINEADELIQAVKGGKNADVSATQLRALQNTAKLCALPDLEDYISKRQKRRAETDENESAFWGALLDSLRMLRDEVAVDAIQACGAPETTPDTVRAGTLDHRTVKTIVARRYLSHFVAHCQYLQHL